MISLISSDEINARHFHSTKLLIDGLCVINDSGELGRSFCDIYPKDLGMKVQHQGHYVTFLNSDTAIKEGTFIVFIVYLKYSIKEFVSLFNCENASYRKQNLSKYFLISNKR